MASSARLKYRIVRCSSEDPEYPVTELLAHSSQTKGWQTARFCDFPQEIGLQFENPVHLRQVQFLSHQSKIATKIELFTAMPAEGQECRYETAQFKRLGYLSLDSNERSQFQARELKSVYVDVSAQFLRILLHKCHVNRYNIVNQVGLVALHCLGEALGPDLAVGPPPPNPALARGPPPAAAPAAPAVSASAAAAAAAAAPRSSQANHQQDRAQDAAEAIADEMRYDPRTLERIRSLSLAKQRAVEAEDYEEAKRCKEMLGRLRQTGLLLRELEDRKRQAVQNEDFDAAKALKAEIERLRQVTDRPQLQSGGSSSTASRASPVTRAASAGNGAAGECRTPEWAQPAQGPPQMAGPRGAHQPVMAQSPMSFAAAADADAHGGRAPGHPTRTPSSPSASPSPSGMREAPSFDPRPSRDSAVSPPLPANGGARAVRSPPTNAVGSSRPPAPERPSPGDAAGHPLSGVANIEDLGPPDPLSASVEKDAEPLLDIFGEYVTQCLYSRAWNLRDAALQKLTLNLKAGIYSSGQSGQLLHALATVLRHTLPDKNVQVFLSSANLLQMACQRLLARGPVRRPEAQAELDPLLPLLTERLGDANARVEKTARDVLFDLARSPAAGAPFTAQYLLRPPKKKTVPPRVYTSRLQLLASLAKEAGVQPENRDGIPLEPTAQLAMEWFSNPAGDVREAAVKLVAACYAHVGINRIEKYLAKLRPAQREVFDAEFEKASLDGGNGAAPQAHGGADAYGNAEGEDDEADASICQFCGRHDPAFTPEAMDVHYWRECPMLTQCEMCQQVIEISSLRTHLEEECESGAAARSAAQALPSGRCPLCRAGLGAGEDIDWREHLLSMGCPRNPRNQFRQGLG